MSTEELRKGLRTWNKLVIKIERIPDLLQQVMIDRDVQYDLQFASRCNDAEVYLANFNFSQKIILVQTEITDLQDL